MTMLEFETEPVKGIPGQLPYDERVLWQGVPTWRSLMVHVLHVRWLAAYFAIIMVWRAGWHLAEGNGWAVASSSAAWLGVLGLFVATLMAGVALLMKRSTVYTITSKRVILRFGMVVPICKNRSRRSQKARRRHRGNPDHRRRQRAVRLRLDVAARPALAVHGAAADVAIDHRPDQGRRHPGKCGGKNPW